MKYFGHYGLLKYTNVNDFCNVISMFINVILKTLSVCLDNDFLRVVLNTSVK